MKDTLLLNSVISCEELMNRWSVTESRLVKIISENKIKKTASNAVFLGEGIFTMGYSKNYIMYWGVFTVIIIPWTAG